MTNIDALAIAWLYTIPTVSTDLMIATLNPIIIAHIKDMVNWCYSKTKCGGYPFVTKSYSQEWTHISLFAKL